MGADHTMEVYSKVMRGIARASFPKTCSGPVGDLIKALLEPVAIDRLAMRQGDISNVTDHEWFSGFDWGAMRAQSLVPPYVPVVPTPPKDLECSLKLEHYLDMTNFSTQNEPLPAPVEYHDDMSGWDVEFAT